MNPAHTLFLVSCVVLACGGGCFECKPPPAPPAPAVQVEPAQQLEAKAPQLDANGQPLVVSAETAGASATPK